MEGGMHRRKSIRRKRSSSGLHSHLNMAIEKLGIKSEFIMRKEEEECEGGDGIVGRIRE